MAKYDSPTTPPVAAHLDRDGRALVAALTAAILAARPDAPPVNEAAAAAAAQYRQIRLALRTHAEPLPKAGSTGTSATATAATSSSTE